MNRRLRRAIAFVPFRAAMLALAPLERRLLEPQRPLAGPPVFIVGPPRSGTTLLVDVLVARFAFAYIATTANRLWKTPAAATVLARRAIRAYAGVFESRHGHIEAWGAPNEGGAVWQSWYDESRPLDEEDLARVDAARIRSTIAAISHVVEAPFVSKNVMHSMHIRFLDVLFPGCLFVEVRRDDLDTARSILRLRVEESGDLTAWRSIRPPGHEPYLQSSPATQVCAQILLTRERIERDIARIGEERRLVVQYEDLCRDPLATLKALQGFVEAHGGRLVSRDCRLPEFSARRSKPVPGVPDEELIREFARLDERLRHARESEPASRHRRANLEDAALARFSPSERKET